MCGRDRHQPPQTSSFKGLEAGFYLYEPSLNTSSTSSSSLASSPTSSTASSTTPAVSRTKKRRWYRPRLRINLHADWIWAGFIRAGNTTPTGHGQVRGQRVKDDDEGWEQLPAYAPLEEGRSEQMERIGETRRDGQDQWVIEPPSIEPGHRRRAEGDVEPPEYRQRDR